MNRKCLFNILAYISLFSMVVFQLTSPLFLHSGGRIESIKLYNVFLLYCVSKAAFGESAIMFLLIACFIVSAFIVSMVKILKSRKIFFIIPFLIIIIDCIFHCIFCLDAEIAWIGLIYKIITCIIFLIPVLSAIKIHFRARQSEIN